MTNHSENSNNESVYDNNIPRVEDSSSDNTEDANNTPSTSSNESRGPKTKKNYSKPTRPPKQKKNTNACICKRLVQNEILTLKFLEEEQRRLEETHCQRLSEYEALRQRLAEQIQLYREKKEAVIQKYDINKEMED